MNRYFLENRLHRSVNIMANIHLAYACSYVKGIVFHFETWTVLHIFFLQNLTDMRLTPLGGKPQPTKTLLSSPSKQHKCNPIWLDRRYATRGRNSPAQGLPGHLWLCEIANPAPSESTLYHCPPHFGPKYRDTEPKYFLQDLNTSMTTKVIDAIQLRNLLLIDNLISWNWGRKFQTSC